MKRKGRKSKGTENGVDDREEQNGEASERDDQADQDSEPEEKKRKSGKRKSSSKKTEETAEQEAQYEVEQVLDEKFIRGVRHYLIRWKGYEPESDTWEPESTLNCAELIAEFKAKQKKKGKAKVQLSKKRGRDPKAPDITWDENENFEVDRILDVYFKKNGSREFLVSWKGYPAEQNSWEPEENMDCKDLIKRFMEKVERAKESDQRELRVKRTHTDRFTLSTDVRGRRLSRRNKGRQRVHYHDAE